MQRQTDVYRNTKDKDRDNDRHRGCYKTQKDRQDSPKRADTEGQERQRHSHIDRGAATTQRQTERQRETHLDTDVDKKDTEKETDIVPKKQTGMDRKDTETRRNTKKNRRCHSKKTWTQRHR